jgi:hypothetical protein
LLLKSGLIAHAMASSPIAVVQQDLRARGDDYFYHNNAIWPGYIAADGEVTNAANS